MDLKEYYIFVSNFIMNIPKYMEEEKKKQYQVEKLYLLEGNFIKNTLYCYDFYKTYDHCIDQIKKQWKENN